MTTSNHHKLSRTAFLIFSTLTGILIIDLLWELFVSRTCLIVDHHLPHLALSAGLVYDFRKTRLLLSFEMKSYPKCLSLVLPVTFFPCIRLSDFVSECLFLNPMAFCPRAWMPSCLINLRHFPFAIFRQIHTWDAQGSSVHDTKIQNQHHATFPTSII